MQAELKTLDHGIPVRDRDEWASWSENLPMNKELF
jgi:hypothetical protein